MSSTEAMRHNGVTVLTNTRVAEVRADGVKPDDGEWLAAATTVATTRHRWRDWRICRRMTGEGGWVGDNIARVEFFLYCLPSRTQARRVYDMLRGRTRA